MRTLFGIVLLILFSCSKENQSVVQSKVKNESSSNTGIVEVTVKVQKEAEDKLIVPVADSVIIKQKNAELLQILKSKNYSDLGNFVHPEKGVVFSMYAYLHKENKHFSQEDFKKFVPTPTKFTWGRTDGEGNTVVFSIGDYLKNWVFKRDFSNSKFSFNQFQGQGNSINNLKEKYPNADFTENHIETSAKFSGMDWFSLRFVFEKYQGEYYLVAVINDQWTI